MDEQVKNITVDDQQEYVINMGPQHRQLMVCSDLWFRLRVK